MLRDVSSQLDGKGYVTHIPLSEENAPDSVVIADVQLLLGGHFKKTGSDLIITGDDGHKVIVSNYFGLSKHPDLVTPQGAGLSAHVVERLAVSDTAGQYAQVGAPAGAAVIGK